MQCNAPTVDTVRFSSLYFIEAENLILYIAKDSDKFPHLYTHTVFFNAMKERTRFSNVSVLSEIVSWFVRGTPDLLDFFHIGLSIMCAILLTGKLWNLLYGFKSVS
jgi:hypothetical protein